MWELIVSPVTSIIRDVLKRILPPEKMSEEEKAKLEQELTLAVMQQDWQRFEKEIQDRISARELAKSELEKGNAFTNILAATHRPIWSFVTLGLFVWSIVSGQFGLPPVELTDIHKSIMQTVIIFYFGGRSIEKAITTIKGN